MQHLRRNVWKTTEEVHFNDVLQSMVYNKYNRDFKPQQFRSIAIALSENSSTITIFRRDTVP